MFGKKVSQMYFLSLYHKKDTTLSIFRSLLIFSRFFFSSQSQTICNERFLLFLYKFAKAFSSKSIHFKSTNLPTNQNLISFQLCFFLGLGLNSIHLYITGISFFVNLFANLLQALDIHIT